MSKSNKIENQSLAGDYRMMTAEIVFSGQDVAAEAITWRDYDRTPGFPRLRAFLTRWRENQEYQIKSVTVTEITDSQAPACKFSPPSALLH